MANYKYKSGERLPDTRWGPSKLTFVEPVENVGIHGHFSNGMYWVICDCFESDQYQISGLDIRRGSSRAYCCGVGKCERPPRLEQRRFRPPADHVGKVVGRLIISAWVPGRGWECICDCGQLEYVPSSQRLLVGLQPCRHARLATTASASATL